MKLSTSIFLILSLGLWNCSRNTSENVNRTASLTHAFTPYLDPLSNWSIKIDTIQAEDFIFQEKLENKRKIDVDSLFKIILRTFPKSISLVDSCCVLKGEDKELRICKVTHGEEKNRHGFKVKDFKNGFLIIEEWGYESWGHTSFNPVTQKYFQSLGEPIFINDHLIYSVDNYYGEGEFQIKNLKENKYFGFRTYQWELTRSYCDKKFIYLEFSSYSNHKYLRIQYSE